MSERYKLIEAMAQSGDELDEQLLTAMRRRVRERHLVRSARALIALEAAIPGLSDLLAGKAVIVPVEPTEAMQKGEA